LLALLSFQSFLSSVEILSRPNMTIQLIHTDAQTAGDAVMVAKSFAGTPDHSRSVSAQSDLPIQGVPYTSLTDRYHTSHNHPFSAVFTQFAAPSLHLHPTTLSATD